MKKLFEKKEKKATVKRRVSELLEELGKYEPGTDEYDRVLDEIVKLKDMLGDKVNVNTIISIVGTGVLLTTVLIFEQGNIIKTKAFNWIWGRRF